MREVARLDPLKAEKGRARRKRIVDANESVRTMKRLLEELVEEN